MLRTLSEVTLTLSELSDSGVGKAVRLLKSQPGELGQLARSLVLKWKALLDEHIKRENIQMSELVNKQKNVKKHEKKNGSSNSVVEMGSSFKLPLLQPPVKAPKRHLSPEPISPSLDSSSGLSFEEAMNMTAPVKKNPKKHPKTDARGEKNGFNNLRYPSRAFTQEILSSLSDSFDPPDLEQKASVLKPNGMLIVFFIFK